jgi:hypothetical protein
VPLLAGGLPFVVYLSTMAPTVYGLDSAELTTGSYVLGIVHAPGSPLFLLLGHIFTWLPFGDVGYRVNLLSVCSAAGGVAVLAALVYRLTDRPVVAVAGAWTLAFSYYYWVSALAAELYALEALCIATLLWLAEWWRREQRSWRLCIFAFAYGLALGNHMSLSVLAPGFAYLVLADGAWRRWRLLVVALLLSLLGASVYLYLPLRALAGTPQNYARDWGVDVATWDGFWFMVRGGMFESRFLAVPLSRVPGEFGLFVYRLWSNFVGVGCLVGIVGLVEAPAELRVLRRASLLMLLGHLGFVLTYNVLDKEFMLSPDYLIWGLWVALGAQPAAALVAEISRNRVRLAAGGLMVLLSASNLALNYGLADISGDWSARRGGEAIMETVAPNATFIGTWIQVPVLEYLQLVEGQRPDLETINIFFLQKGRSLDLALERMQRGRPVYTSVPDLFRAGGLGTIREEGCNCYLITPAQAEAQ